MKTATNLLLLFIVVITHSQSKEFGNVSLEELTAKKIDKFPNAEAVILFDKGVTKFYEEDGYNIRFIRTKRIKILKKSGYTWADVSIPFYEDGHGKTEKVSNILAYTYNSKDGKIEKTRFNPENVFTEKVDEYWSLKKFAIPQVKEGSIIEFSYTFETPFLFNLPDWEFQDDIPTLVSEYEVGIIPFYSYVFIAQGMTNFGKKKNFQRVFDTWSSSYATTELKENVFQFGMYDVPAFAGEAFITSKDDYIMKIDFQLSQINYTNGSIKEIITTYPKLIQGLLKHPSYGKFIKQAQSQTKTTVNGLVSGTGSELEKIKKITDYIKKGFDWNSNKRRYAYQNARELIGKRRGNCTELNLMLVGMLRNAGLDAYPVLLSTRDNGKLKLDYPFEEFFNYTIAYVKTGESGLLLDATEDLLPFDRIPPRCFNGSGLIIEKDTENWINLSLPYMSNELNVISISIEDDEIKGSLVRSTTEYESYIAKKRFKNDQTSIYDHFSPIFDEITKSKSLNYDKPDKPYIVAVDGFLEPEEIGNQLFIQPFANLPINENPFKAKRRNYPVDMIYRSNAEYNSTITIPDGYKTIEIPESYNLSNDLAEINFIATAENNTVSSKGKITFKKDLYQPAEYARIKYYFDQIIKYFNSPVVVEKSN